MSNCPLSKGSYLVPQACSFARWEEFGKKDPSEAVSGAMPMLYPLVRREIGKDEETPFSFNAYHTSKKTEMCRFGSSIGAPSTCAY